MNDPVESFWQKRLAALRSVLEANRFEAFVVQTLAEAKDLVLRTLLPNAPGRIVSFGGSMTLAASGLVEALRTDPGWTVIDTHASGLTPEESYERRRQALLADAFLMGTNAVTEDGALVNLDMIGNRVGALGFGPRKVVVLVGRNKIVKDREAARDRIKLYAAPANAIRLDKKTPCVKTGCCADCNAPDRICNVWTIHEKSFPKDRVAVVLINQDLGL